MSKENFVHDSKAVEKVLLDYEDGKFKNLIKDAMDIMEGGM